MAPSSDKSNSPMNPHHLIIMIVYCIVWFENKDFIQFRCKEKNFNQLALLFAFWYFLRLVKTSIFDTFFTNKCTFYNLKSVCYIISMHVPKFVEPYSCILLSIF